MCFGIFGSLTDVPADRHELEERRAVDEVARVVGALVVEVGAERPGIDRVRAEEGVDPGEGELHLGDPVERLHEAIDADHGAPSVGRPAAG